MYQDHLPKPLLAAGLARKVIYSPPWGYGVSHAAEGASTPVMSKLLGYSFPKASPISASGGTFLTNPFHDFPKVRSSPLEFSVLYTALEGHL